MLTKTGRFALATAMLWLVFGAGGRAEADESRSSTPGGLSRRRHVPFRLRHRRDHDRDLVEHRRLQQFREHSSGRRHVQRNGDHVVRDRIDVSRQRDRQHGADHDPVYLADGTLVTTSTTLSGLWSGYLAAIP